MFENPRRGGQARSFTTNVSKLLDLKSSSEQIFFRKLPLGASETKKLKTPHTEIRNRVHTGRTEQELTATPLEPLNKVGEKTEASECTTHGIHKKEMLKLGNCNLKDKVVLRGQYRKTRGSRDSSLTRQ